MEEEFTTIRVPKSLLAYLDKEKIIEREPYYAVIERIINQLDPNY